MHEPHPLDPPPSDVVGVQQAIRLEEFTGNEEQFKSALLRLLYERLANQQRVPVGVVEGGWLLHKGGQHVTIRMRVPTAPLLLDFSEHTEGE